MEIISMKKLINGWFINDDGALRPVLDLVSKDIPINQIYEATNANLEKGILLYSECANLLSWNPIVYYRG